MKISLIHSASSISFILQVLAKSVSAAQNCSYDFRSFCLRFNRLYISNVVLGGALNAASSKAQNSVTEIAKIFTCGFFFEQRPFLVRSLVLKIKSKEVFCPFQPVSFH